MASKWDLSENDWIDAADEALAFVEDIDARGLILYRFEGQYLPALRKARNAEQVWRAWNAFYNYLTFRESRRKFFSLSGEDALRVITTLTDALELPPYSSD